MTVKARQVRKTIRRWLRQREPLVIMWVDEDTGIVARASATRDQLIITVMDKGAHPRDHS